MKMNKRYTDLLFDVDDTLLDFKAAERYSLGQIFDELSLAPFDEVYETYHTISQGLWDASELGLLSVDDVVSQRFGKLLRHYGLTGDGEAIDRQFRSQLCDQEFLMPGAKKWIEQLAEEGYRLSIVTNGVTETQYCRLKKVGLLDRFEAIFISSAIGAQKPATAFFEAVEQGLPDFDRTRALIIGDSLTSDMLGGNRYGIDTVWYNPTGKKNTHAEAKPTYEIAHFDELATIIHSTVTSS